MYTSVAQTDDSEKKISMYCAFDDLRRVAAAFEQVHMVESTADVSYVTQPEVGAAQKDKFANHGVEPSVPSFFYDGQVMFYAQFDGPVTTSKADGLENKMMAFAQQFGELLSFGELDAKNGMARFRAEYHSIKTSQKVLKKCTIASPADVDVSRTSSLSRDSDLADSLTGLARHCHRAPRPEQCIELGQGHWHRRPWHSARQCQRRVTDVRQPHRPYGVVPQQQLRRGHLPW